MVKFGNFLFHYRNILFPVFYLMLFIPSPLIFDDYRIPLIAGLIVALLGQITRVATIGLKYIIRGGKDRQVYAEDLVTGGLFQHTRNPLYVGNVLILAGLGIMSNSLFFNVVMTPLFIFFYQAIIRAEENFLRNKFGAAFDQFCAETNRWIPRLKGIGKTMRSMEFKWSRVVVKEYTTTYIWVSGATLVLLNTFYKMEDSTLFDTYRPMLLILLALWLALYLFARYLKKSNILKPD